MRTVWKYQASPNPFALGLPIGAQVVHFDMQDRAPTIWILVDPDAPQEARPFLVAGTGHPVPEDAQHIGSCIDRDLGLVWHLFEPASPSTGKATGG